MEDCDTPALNELGGLSPAELEFFATGVDKWLPILGDLTFATASIPLDRETVELFARAVFEDGELKSDGFNDGGKLASSIDAKLLELGWDKAFPKLSTRSPKDAPQILSKAKKVFFEQGGLSLPTCERCCLLSELVLQNSCISSGSEALELLATSERIWEDCRMASKAKDDKEFEALALELFLRRWEGKISPASEFRGFAWGGQMHAVSQYWPLYFERFQDQALLDSIAADLKTTYASLQPGLCKAGFDNCMLDFAWLGPADVRVVEINPFDGAELGTMKASTCMFTWDDPKDQQIIKHGPFELRWRTEPKSDIDLKMDMQPAWRQILFASPWDPSVQEYVRPKSEGRGYSKGKGKGKEAPAAKGSSVLA